MVWKIFVSTSAKYFCWKQKISKTPLRSINQTFPGLNWQKMPRMHHRVSLLNDAKIREEASVWSAGLCGFYFCGFSRQNIAGLRLHLLSTGWWISWISQETLNQDQVLQSRRSLGWLKCWLSPSWGEIGAFYQLNCRPSPVLTDIFRATAQTGKCWGRRGEDDHDTPPSPPPGWKVTEHQRSVQLQIWRKMLGKGERWSRPVESYCNHDSEIH